MPWHGLAIEGTKLHPCSILLILCISFAALAGPDPFKYIRKHKEQRALGVILKFKKWSSEAEEKFIRKKLKSYGLISGQKSETAKMWVFHWSENASKNISKSKIKDLVLKPQIEAKQICREVENLPIKSLEYCVPNSLLQPNQNANEGSVDGGPSPCEGVPAPDSNLEDIKEVVEEIAPRKCPPLFATESNDNMKGLSKYWAQEMIGSDLLRKELAAVKQPDSLSLAVFDSPKYNHDILVKNLITDDGLHAVLPELPQGRIPIMKTYFASDYADAADRLKDNKPSFINNSMAWANNRAIPDAFKSLVPPSVLVTGAGNGFPWPMTDEKKIASQEFDAIVVGSLAPEGIASSFSISGKELHILAPSDGFLASALDDGSYERFGGTSGATPLVTGSLAAFHWLSGYHPTGSEAKILLEKTAIPTIHSRERPRLNGVGMLNTYKLGMVGKRIGKRCAGKDKSCFRREINNQENYIFKPKIPKEKLLFSATNYFPGCAKGGRGKGNRGKIDCDKRRELLGKLRRAALLNPSQGDLWEFIACIYEEEKLPRNAEGLRMIALASSSAPDNREIIKKLKSISYVTDDKKLRESKLAGLRYRLGDKKSGLEVFNKLAKDGGRWDKLNLIFSRDIIGEDEKMVPLIELLAKDEDRLVMQEAQKKLLLEVYSMEDDKMISWLKLLSKYENRTLRELLWRKFMTEVDSMEADKVIPLLALFAKDKDDYIRKLAQRKILLKANSAKDDKFVLLLGLLIEDVDKDISELAKLKLLRKSDSVEDAKIISLLKVLAKDENKYIRKSARKKLLSRGVLFYD